MKQWFEGEKMINTEYAPNEVRKIRIKKLRRNQEKYEDGRNEDNKRIKKR